MIPRKKKFNFISEASLYNQVIKMKIFSLPYTTILSNFFYKNLYINIMPIKFLHSTSAHVLGFCINF